MGVKLIAKLTPYLLAAAIASFIIGIAVCIGFAAYLNIRDRNSYERFLSSHLSQEAVNDLCNQELLSPEFGDCGDENIVIEYREIPDIVNANLPLNPNRADVDSSIGLFEQRCEHQDGVDNYTCDYQIDKFFFRIKYDERTNKVQEIVWP